MSSRTRKYALLMCRSLYRERGLKYSVCDPENNGESRSLYRERGLKCLLNVVLEQSGTVVPCIGNVD